MQFLSLILALNSLVSPVISRSAQEWIQSYGDSNGIVNLDAQQITELLDAQKRDYHALVLFTTESSSTDCPSCKDLAPAFEAYASSWKAFVEQNPDMNNLVIAKVLFPEQQEVFAALNMRSIPVLNLFAPKNRKPLQFKRMSAAVDPDDIAQFTNPEIQRSFEIKRPVNHSVTIGIVFTAISLALALYLFQDIAVAIVNSKELWALASIIFIVIMNSGYMFVKIKGMPRTIMNNDQSTQWLMPQLQNQLGAEVQVLAVCFSILACGAVFLANPRHKGKNFVVSGLWILIQVGVASFVFSMFRTKMPGYPYKLFI